MRGPGAIPSVSAPPVCSLIIAFVVATEQATTASQDEELFFGDLDGLLDQKQPDEVVNAGLVAEVVGEIKQIKDNGVGSPEVRKYVDAWSPPVSPLDSKDAQLRILAENLYQRRPVLYLQGHTQPYPAQVLLRTVRKPSVGALTKAATAAGLFQSPSNTFIVIKFDPQFGYADIIVDPCFTDAFIQQPSTATYNKLLSELPRAFVGTATELRRMVALLTQQSIRAYSAKGTTAPPWRRFGAMLARWLPKMFKDEVITHGPGMVNTAVNSTVHSAAKPAAVAPGLLSDTGSTSSMSSSGWSFSLASSGDVSGSFSSSGSSASSAPRTVVYGFDIPVANVIATEGAAEQEDEGAAEQEGVIVPEALVVAVPPVTTPFAVEAAAGPAISKVLQQQQQQQQQQVAVLNSVTVKMAAAAAADHTAAAAAASSWQLAAGIVEACGESDGGLSSSNCSSSSFTAAIKRVSDIKDDGDVAAPKSEIAAAEEATAETAAAAAAQAAPPGLQLPPPSLKHNPAMADPSHKLLAAAGYGIRSVKLASSKGGSRMSVEELSLKPAVATATGHERVCCGCKELMADAASIHGVAHDVRLVSSSNNSSRMRAWLGLARIKQAVT